eukprot:7147790-Pyramimonas_sp.AAC.1
MKALRAAGSQGVAGEAFPRRHTGCAGGGGATPCRLARRGRRGASLTPARKSARLTQNCKHRGSTQRGTTAFSRGRACTPTYGQQPPDSRG